MTATRSRRSATDAHSRGRVAEQAAVDHLVAQGFAILWRNLRIGSLELDIVAKKGDLVVIVEVRTRGEGSYEKPLASISKTKIRTLLRASRALWRGRLSKMRDVMRVRIDVIAVTGDDLDEIEWITGAITENDA